MDRLMGDAGTLIFFCGKMGSGKSTLAKSMAEELGAILMSEDEWLSRLYGDEIRGFEEYVKYSARLKPLLKDHVRSILESGAGVVMDFPANTRRQREWFRQILGNDAIPHRLVYLDVDDAVCLERIAQRGSSDPDRARFDTEEMFRRVTGYFEPPCDDEGFAVEIVRHDP